jgi:4-hydroxy-tetrahydrodipicolinate synthase
VRNPGPPAFGGCRGFRSPAYSNSRDLDGAIALNLKLYPLLRGVALESSPIPVKYMLKRLGVLKTNEHRSPMVPASPEIEKHLDKILAEIGLI